MSLAERESVSGMLGGKLSRLTRSKTRKSGRNASPAASAAGVGRRSSTWTWLMRIFAARVYLRPRQFRDVAVAARERASSLECRSQKRVPLRSVSARVLENHMTHLGSSQCERPYVCPSS